MYDSEPSLENVMNYFQQIMGLQFLQLLVLMGILACCVIVTGMRVYEQRKKR